MKTFYISFICALIFLQFLQFTKGAKCKDCSSKPIFKRLACRLKCDEKKKDSNSKEPVQSPPITSTQKPKEPQNPNSSTPRQQDQTIPNSSTPRQQDETIPNSSTLRQQDQTIPNTSTPKPTSETSLKSSNDNKVIINVSDKTLTGSSSRGATPSSINQEVHPIGGVV